MLRTKPSLTYCGLTVVLSNPSRFDTARLLTATGGQILNTFCLRPEFNIMQCDVRIADDKSPWLPGTKCILLLGEYAMHSYVPKTRNNVLNEMRGSLFSVQGIPAIVSYFPQDCADMKAYEEQFNEGHLSHAEVKDEGDDEKRLGSTSRKNFAWWLKMDCKKVKYILKNGMPKIEEEPRYVNYPSSDEVIQVLSTTKEQHLYFDIETDYEEQNLQCFSFTFDGRTVFNVPILDYNYKLAYSSFHYIMRALAVACKNNIVVAHNGACFDYIVLAYKYRIAVKRVYDTMVAMHRCYPTVEKSLGHCTSFWTWQPFHKDQDSHGYMTAQQMKDRMAYCGKDVFTMFLIKQAIDKYAKTVVGLEHSIKTAMDSIVPYITATMQGILVDMDLREKMRYENDRLMEQYLRMIKLLIGEAGLNEVHKCIKGKAGAFPGSNKQCVEYFHNILGYPVVGRSPVNQHGIRNPSLNKLNMFKLRLKHDNPVIDLCNLYRGVALETSTPLGFLPWKNNEGKTNYESTN
jgi:hypothetical protein